MGCKSHVEGFLADAFYWPFSPDESCHLRDRSRWGNGTVCCAVVASKTAVVSYGVCSPSRDLCLRRGGVHEVTRPHTGRVAVGALVRLSIEQLSINQIVPTGGVSGSFLVFQAMRRLGLPRWLATEALIAEMLSAYIAYAVVATLAFTLLLLMGRVTVVLCYLLAAFVLSVLAIVVAIVWLLLRKNRPLPKWLGQFKSVFQLYDAARHASADRILGRRLLAVTTAINVVIFLLDGTTLWAMMHVAGAPIGIPSAFVAIVIGFVAGTVSFLPGGIGSFEAGCVATLAILGSPFEAALAGTLLFRGLTLWIPLLPGLMLARQDVKITV